MPKIQSAKSNRCKWSEGNARTLKSLEQMLGAVRKAEKATQNRLYTDRTDVVKKAINQGTWETKTEN